MNDYMVSLASGTRYNMLDVGWSTDFNGYQISFKHPDIHSGDRMLRHDRDSYTVANNIEELEVVLAEMDDPVYISAMQREDIRALNPTEVDA